VLCHDSSPFLFFSCHLHSTKKTLIKMQKPLSAVANKHFTVVIDSAMQYKGVCMSLPFTSTLVLYLMARLGA
jgi:hypothetical protein